MTDPLLSHPLAGRTAAITGGARGLGFAIAEAIAAAGADVALLDLLDASAAATELAGRGSRAIAVPLDVSDPTSVSTAFDEVSERLGAPDILINAAGITSGVPLVDLEADEWNRVMSVNLTGTFLTSREFARRRMLLDTSRESTIVNVSSMSAFAVNIPQTQAAYNTSKAAVTMFTQSAAVEWLRHGIRVNAIAPGYFASDMTRDFVADHPEMAREWIDRIPAGRMGQPHELGPLVVYLASEASGYMVGQSILLDGGYTAV